MKKSIFIISILLLFARCLFAQPANLANGNGLDSAPPAVQSSITKAINRTTQAEDEVWLSNPQFQSQFTNEYISLRPSDNDLEWQWQLRTINGQAPQSVAPTLREAYNQEFVDYQRGNITLHEYFNHNDLLHLLQVVAVVLFYRGTLLLLDLPKTQIKAT